MKEFVEAVRGLLMVQTASPSHGQLAVTVIRFLTTVAESVHHALFGSPEAMKQICDSVVVPNLQLRDEDEEDFEGKWVEYVRRDSEGSDSDTLRRAARVPVAEGACGELPGPGGYTRVSSGPADVGCIYS